MSYKNLIIHHEDRIALVTIHRPKARNALNLHMVRELHSALDALSLEVDLRCLIITGSGDRAFVAGADIRELAERSMRDAFLAINSSLFQKLEQIPFPTIAAIRGFALGGGCELALACDIRICGESARLGQPEVGLGIIPAAGATQRLPRVVGLGRAKEMILTGRILDANEAERIGLVNRVVPDDRVLDECWGVARRIADQAPLAVRLAKQAMNASQRTGSDTGFLIENLSQGILFDSAEKKKRMRAFLKGSSRGKMKR